MLLQRQDRGGRAASMGLQLEGRRGARQSAWRAEARLASMGLQLEGRRGDEAGELHNLLLIASMGLQLEGRRGEHVVRDVNGDGLRLQWGSSSKAGEEARPRSRWSFLECFNGAPARRPERRRRKTPRPPRMRCFNGAPARRPERSRRGGHGRVAGRASMGLQLEGRRGDLRGPRRAAVDLVASMGLQLEGRRGERRPPLRMIPRLAGRASAVPEVPAATTPPAPGAEAASPDDTCHRAHRRCMAAGGFPPPPMARARSAAHDSHGLR